MKRWTKNEAEILIRLFSDTRTQSIADTLGRTYRSVATQATLQGLHKSEAFRKTVNSGRIFAGDERGVSGRFQKGHVSHNKGKKWDEYLSKEKQEKARKTTFKPGIIPHNTKKNNEITWRNHKGRAYQYIRIAKAKWIQLHVYNWEKKYGKAPKGLIIVFKTHSTENCEVENLELITREENMKRNSLHRFPEELRKAIQVVGALKRQINKRI